MKWELQRPLACFDIESTGINRKADRIIDLAIVKIHPDQSRTSHTYRVNPEMPIPPESSEVHGITDEDVKDCPTFSMIALEVLDCLEGCDLLGFNIIHFDIPMLEEEFRRADLRFTIEGRNIIDAQRIYHKREPRDLGAALNFYCNEMHQGAHGALADVEATLRVLEGQLDRYEDLPREMKDLNDFCDSRPPNAIDRKGWLRHGPDGDIIIHFGKHQGKSLYQMKKKNKGFLTWILKSDFPSDMQDVVREVLKDG